jgi:hypothetical protein
VQETPTCSRDCIVPSNICVSPFCPKRVCFLKWKILSLQNTFRGQVFLSQTNSILAQKHCETLLLLIGIIFIQEKQCFYNSLEETILHKVDVSNILKQ